MSERDGRPPALIAPEGADGEAMSLEDVLAAVEACLVLDEIAPQVWRGPNVVLPGYGRIFGGQLLAQAIAAAVIASGDGGKVVRSLHLVFTAEGRPETKVDWSVEALHDGRTFATRWVTARQGARVIATGAVSMHAPDRGGRVLEHSIGPPLVPASSEVAAIGQLGAMAFETRPVLPAEALSRRPGSWLPFGDTYDPRPQPEPPEAGSSDPERPAESAPTLDGLAVGPPELAVWMRAPRAPGGGMDQLGHQELLAYASDLTMMVAAMRPHEGVGFGASAVTASTVTSHTISFHRHIRVEDWHLFVQESPVAAGGRAYIRGDVFDVSGVVVASCAQEVLIRVVDGA